MEKAHIIEDAAELREMLRGDSPPLLVDVRLEEEFAACHLPGACNNCTFEVVFLDRMERVAADLHRPVCVYGAGAGSLESRMAAEKLCRMGYQVVLEFPGGMEAWKAAGFPVEENAAAAPSPPVITDGRMDLDLQESRVRWIGRNLLNRHEGYVAIKSGWIEIRDGALVAGEFVIDMEKITCLDLAGDALHDVLIRHLLDHDFFDSALYPEATFRIANVTPVGESTPGSPNLRIQGEMELKGVILPLAFDACAGITPEGKPAAQATLAFDRTLWNVLYGSGKWFRHPGGHLVNDLIELQLRVVGG
ncbi:MAG: YceI family protein [Verrucomicrobiota bacterium]